MLNIIINVITDRKDIPEPEDDCGFGIIGVEIFLVTIQMTQAEINAWNAASGLTIVPV